MKLNELKKIISGLRANYKAAQELLRFNSETQNDIQSTDVAFGAIKGHHVTISKGALLCPNSSIGSYSYIGLNTLISKTSIGRYCSIASNVNIGHGEHPLESVSTNSLFIADAYARLTQKDCSIENDVWIGCGATIRRGVTVGTGSVVGANSFVNKDVPPYAVVGGVPAKIIRYRFNEEKIQKILDSKWWESDLTEARTKIEQLEKDI